ncbi:MAG: histone deacetylase [Gemmatimonadaceae bacterium]|nr:histone deacetylase [Gemmatimonadaceae bacterium]
MATAFLSHADCGRHDTGWGHVEHVGRLRAITRALRSAHTLFDAVTQHEGRHATVDELALAHDRGYLASLEATLARGGGALDADTITSEGSWDATRAATGCVLDGVDLAVSGQAVRSFCAVRPPGHHALRDRAMGFCLTGHVAIAAHHARTRHAMDRVLIVDWDVHHGNGTQALVEQDAQIRFVSMHQWPWYPGTGAADDRGPYGSVWNVPMAPGLPAATYRDALLRAVDAATNRWTPDLVLLSAGFDCLAVDPLGGFTLEVDDIVLLTDALVDRATHWCGGRLVSALEGGYDPDATAAAAVAHLDRLARP